jgi:hypothetical protein
MQRKKSAMFARVRCAMNFMVGQKNPHHAGLSDLRETPLRRHMTIS